MEGYNQVTLVGNLGADPEQKALPSGSFVLKLRVACTESYKDRGGERQEKTEWVNVVVFGGQGEGLAKFLTKGMTVFVVGRMETRSYTDRDGQKRSATEVVAHRVIAPAGRRGRQEREDPPEAGAWSALDEAPPF